MTTKTKPVTCECGATYPRLDDLAGHWHGPAAMVELLVPVGSVNRWPGNPRQGDVGAISESLRRFGQQKPVVVQASTMFVAAGNHMLDAAKSLGWSRIAANVSDLDDREAEAYLIADNRTAELGTYDEDALGAFLRKMAAEGNLTGTGYDGDDVDEFLNRLSKEQKVRPELEFSLELMESHNYVVLYFDNDLDWKAAQTKLGLESVQDWDSTETYQRMGVGRIIKGASVIRAIPD